MTLEQFTAHRRRWRLAKFYEIALAHGALGTGQVPRIAMMTAKSALEAWEKENPTEYADEFALETGK